LRGKIGIWEMFPRENATFGRCFGAVLEPFARRFGAVCALFWPFSRVLMPKAGKALPACAIEGRRFPLVSDDATLFPDAAPLISDALRSCVEALLISEAAMRISDNATPVCSEMLRVCSEALLISEAAMQIIDEAEPIHSEAMPMSSEAKHPTIDIHNLLITLAWLGELRTDHVHRLWMHDRALGATQRLLRELREEGYVERRRWARWMAQRTTPTRQSALWSISRKGRELVRDHEQYPPEYKEPRARRMVVHDSTTSEAIVRIIELGRAVEHDGRRGLSGLYVEREVRLDPARSRPVMDALIIVTVGGDFDRPDLIPWSRDPTLDGERRVRYALENDRDTEPPTVIAAKAQHYQHAGTPAWERHYGRFPLPMWLAPSVRRLEQILQLWRHAWPVGKWVMTTDDWLRDDYWIACDRGVVTERSLFYTTPLRRPTLNVEEQTRLNRILKG
jgi:hypothetical protein